MSEDRTQEPSKRKRQEAKSLGLITRSPELTAAVGLLAAVVALGVWGGPLAIALTDLVRKPFWLPPNDLESVVSAMRVSILRVAGPLLEILISVGLAMTVAHQAQAGGMWATGLIAPDGRRLWSISAADWSSRAARGAWGIAKTAAIVAVASWSIRNEWPRLSALSSEDAGSLAMAAAGSLRKLAFSLGVATLILGLVDYLLAHRRVEAMLRSTPEETREEAKSVDGDPAVKARRLRLAKSWRSDPGEVLKGSVLVVTGERNTAVVLGGQGPPGRVIVRASARGASGAALKRSATNAGLRVIESKELARHFASPAARGVPLSDELSRELAAIWTRDA